jgi:hypothetical protein
MLKQRTLQRDQRQFLTERASKMDATNGSWNHVHDDRQIADHQDH